MLPQEKQASLIPTKQQYLIVQNPQNGDYKVNFIYFIAKLYENRWKLTRIVLFCLTTTMLLVFLQKPQYQVRSSLTTPTDSNYSMIVNNLRNHKFKESDFRSISESLFDRFTMQLLAPSNIISFIKDTNLIESNVKNTATKYSINSINNLSKKIITKIFSKDKAELITIFPNLNKSQDTNRAYLNYTSQKVLKTISIEYNASNAHLIKRIESSIAYFKELNAINHKTNDKAYPPKIAKLQLELDYRKALRFDTSDVSIYRIEGSPIIEIITNTKYILRIGLFLSIMSSFLWLVFQCNIIESKNDV